MQAHKLSHRKYPQPPHLKLVAPQPERRPLALCIFCPDNAIVPTSPDRTRVNVEKSFEIIGQVNTLVYFGSGHRAHTAYRYSGYFAHGCPLDRRRQFEKITDVRYHSPTDLTRVQIGNIVANEYLANGYDVAIYLNGISSWLTRWVIRKECRRAGLKIKLDDHTFIISCGGTFFFNLHVLKLRIIPWWLRHVLGEEIWQAFNAFKTYWR